MEFIEINGLRKVYGKHEVLKAIDLSVDRHQVVSLIGASGSAKSTLLRCIKALEIIDGGQIALDGDVVSGPGVDQNRLRRKVGMVFQSFNLFPHLSVEENIMAGPMRLLGASRAEARALLDRVHLDKRRPSGRRPPCARCHGRAPPVPPRLKAGHCRKPAFASDPPALRPHRSAGGRGALRHERRSPQSPSPPAPHPQHVTPSTSPPARHPRLGCHAHREPAEFLLRRGRDLP